MNKKTPRKMPHVGIFWLVQTPNGEMTLLAAGCPLDQAEPYGDCLTYSPGHYKTWAHWRRDKTVDPALRALVQAYEYEDWPRGRIVFERARDLFIIYADRKLPTTPQREYASDLFPVNRIFASAEWRQKYNEHWQYAREKIQLFDAFESKVIKRFEQYLLPVIELKKETPKEAVCLVFERVNSGGVALTVFELLTASFAADNFRLRHDWETREQRLKTEHPVLRNLQSVDFLQAISPFGNAGSRQPSRFLRKTSRRGPLSFEGQEVSRVTTST